MKKIPTLFERKYENHRVVDVLPNCHAGMEWVLEGEGVATVKIDGACCAIFDGEFYRRYDAKRGKTPPDGAIPCCDPDPITGHHPHWIKVEKDDPSSKWFISAYQNTPQRTDGTYEAVGIHFQGNPYLLDKDWLVKHGALVVDVERSFDGIKEWLRTHNEEGLVFWLDGEPMCKIKRSDFGFPWPCGGKDGDEA